VTSIWPPLCHGGCRLGRTRATLCSLCVWECMKMMISQKKSWGKTMLTLIFFWPFYTKKLPMMGDFSWLLFQSCPWTHCGDHCDTPYRVFFFLIRCSPYVYMHNIPGCGFAERIQWYHNIQTLMLSWKFQTAWYIRLEICILILNGWQQLTAGSTSSRCNGWIVC